MCSSSASEPPRRWVCDIEVEGLGFVLAIRIGYAPGTETMLDDGSVIRRPFKLASSVVVLGLGTNVRRGLIRICTSSHANDCMKPVSCLHSYCSVGRCTLSGVINVRISLVVFSLIPDLQIVLERCMKLFVIRPKLLLSCLHSRYI